jgi:hypothetical protein
VIAAIADPRGALASIAIRIDAAWDFSHNGVDLESNRARRVFWDGEDR